MLHMRYSKLIHYSTSHVIHTGWICSESILTNFHGIFVAGDSSHAPLILFYFSEGCSAVLSFMSANKVLDNFTTSETQKYLIPRIIMIVIDVGIGNKDASRYERKIEQQPVTNSFVNRRKSFEALNTLSIKNEFTFLDYVEPSTDQISTLECGNIIMSQTLAIQII
jgi:hypothetical protein